MHCEAQVGPVSRRALRVGRAALSRSDTQCTQGQPGEQQHNNQQAGRRKEKAWEDDVRAQAWPGPLGCLHELGFPRRAQGSIGVVTPSGLYFQRETPVKGFWRH